MDSSKQAAMPAAVRRLRGGIRSARLAVGALVVLLLSTTMAAASVPHSETEIISACYLKAGGAVRVIDAEAGETCRRGEVAISWSERGPQGEPGEAGPAGEPGAKGERGDPGPAGPASLAALSGSACTRQNGSAGAVVVNVHSDDSITFRCDGSTADWCATNTPAVGSNMSATCDEATDTLTFTCVATWYDFNADHADGCEAQLEPLPSTLETVQAAADSLFLGTHDVDMAPTCGSSLEIACANGVPVSPLPQVRVVGSAVTASGSGPFVVQGNLAVISLQPIPIRGFGLNCTLSINTAPGANPTAHISATVNLTSHDDPSGLPNRLDLTNVNLSNLHSEDFAVGGGFLCSFASFGLDFMISSVRESVERYLESSGALCGAPGPNLFIACPGDPWWATATN